MPRVAFASALAVGFESTGDFLDFETTAPVNPATVQSTLNASLPQGIGIDAVVNVETGSPSLGDLVNAARYTVLVGEGTGNSSTVGDLMAALSSSPHRVVTRKRKGKEEEVDVVPSIHRIRSNGKGEIEMILRMGQPKAARPDDVVRGLYGPEAGGTRIIRQELLVFREEDFVSPLSLCSSADLPRPRVPMVT